MNPRCYTQGRQCGSCSDPISDRSRSGLCRICFNRKIASDPAVLAKKSASLKAYAANPENKAIISQRGKQAAHTRWQNPEYAEKALRLMREVVQPGSLTHPDAKVFRRASALASVEKRMSWCPAEYREQYRQLTGLKDMKASEARAMILEQVRKDKERELAKLTPFERQMRALQNGGELIEMGSRATLDRPGVFRA